jgi:uncharacterized membrane protein
MPPIASLFPDLPWTGFETVVHVIAGLGIIFFIYAIFLKAEKKQDALLAIGAACLLVYAVWVQSTVFILAMLGLMISCLVEFTEIILGKHKTREE